MAKKVSSKKAVKKAAAPASPPKFAGEVMACAAAEYADDKKAENIVILDMREISPVTDYMVVCSATSLPQLRAVRDEIEDQFRKNHQVRPLAGDRNLESGWLIQHYGDVMVHIFLPEKREFYALEDLDYAHIWGSHFYPDLASGSIDDWAKLAKVAPDRPLWHTELHMRESDEPAENIAKVRDGLAILFKTNQMGVQGYGWWARAHEDDKFANLIRRKAIVSLLGGACIKTSGQYEAKDNKPAAELAQATRVGDTVWLWYCNPGQAKTELPILLKSGNATKASGESWSGGGTANAQTKRALDVSVAGGANVIVKNLPATSVALVRIDLTASAATPAKNGGILVAYREWSSADPNARKILAALVSVSNGIGRFKRPDGSTFDYPLNKLSAADRKLAEDAAK
jgi:ribosome silencing factor RsfS/YbeB/iojap